VKGRFYRQSKALTEAIDEFFEEGPPHSVWDELASNQRQENAECAEKGPEVKRLVNCADDSVLQTTFLDQTSAAAPASTATSERLPLMTDDEYYNLTRSLNRRQRKLFQFVLNCCRSKRQCDTKPPFYVYCTGGAVVGKSHLIYAIVQMVNWELRQPGGNPDDVIVILTAPTGTAAYVIQGQTLHSAFMISAKGITTLSAEKLAMLRNKFSKLILIIIDEVSIVGGNLLKLVHERCAATRELPLALPFAGISVLAIGDFQHLSPVGESPVYKPPRSGYVALAELWMSNLKVVKLTDIMRQ